MENKMAVNITIEKIKSAFDMDKISKILDKTKNVEVLIIGDTIIDEYVFVHMKGRAVKDPILSTSFMYEEKYAGGVLAIANHASDFVKNITLVTLIGDTNSQIEFIKNNLNENISLKTFTKLKSPTIVKKRYIDAYRNNKLFKIEYMNDAPISPELSSEIIEFLEEELPKYDMVIVSDFGHGFINDKIRDVISSKSKFVALNVQSNSSNMGYNYANLYKSPDFLVMNEEEMRMPLMMRFEDVDFVVEKFAERFDAKKFIVTVGKNGSIFKCDDKTYKIPALASSVKDTVGAGDALFTMASLMVYSDVDNNIVPFLANCAAGVKVSYMGNKKYVSKERLKNFIKEVYDGLGKL